MAKKNSTSTSKKDKKSPSTTSKSKKTGSNNSTPTKNDEAKSESAKTESQASGQDSHAHDVPSEAAVKKSEHRTRKARSLHRFYFLSDRSHAAQEEAWAGKRFGDTDRLFNELNSVLNPDKLPIQGKLDSLGDDKLRPFSKFTPKQIAKVNALLEDVKSYEAAIAKVISAGGTSEDFGLIKGSEITKGATGKPEIVERIRSGGARKEILQKLLESENPDKSDVLLESTKYARMRGSSIKGKIKGEDKQQKDTIFAERQEAAEQEAQRKAQEAERRKQERIQKNNSRKLQNQRKNLASIKESEGANEETIAGILHGSMDSVISDNPELYTDKAAAITVARNHDAQARAKEQEAQRKAQEAARKKYEEENKKELQSHRDAQARVERSLGNNEQAAKVEHGKFDDWITSHWDQTTPEKVDIYLGKKKDREAAEAKAKKEEEARLRQEEAERKKREAEERDRQNELNKKRGLWADYQEYTAQAEGRRFTETERLGITSGGAGRDSEFEGMSVDDLMQKVAGAKDRLDEKRESESHDAEQTMELKQIVRILTGIKLTTSQSKKLMMKLGGPDAIGGLGTKFRLMIAALAVYKTASGMANSSFNAAVKSGGEMSGRKWTMDLMQMSPEERSGIAKESIAARKYGVTNEQVVKSRAKVAEGFAKLQLGDSSFFESLWNAGFNTSGVTNTEEFEKRLTEFLNDKNIDKSQKINVMQALGRTEGQMKFSMNRDREMANVKNEEVQDSAVSADKKEEALNLGRQEIQQRYENKADKINAGNNPFFVKWIQHGWNFMTKLNEQSSLEYDEENNSAKYTNYRPDNFFKGMMKSGLAGFLDVIAPGSGNFIRATEEREASIGDAPSVSEVEQAKEEAVENKEEAKSDNSSSDRGKTEVTQNNYITGSKADAEAIREQMEGMNVALAAAVTSASSKHELGGRA